MALAGSFFGPSALFFLIQVAVGLTVQGSTLIVGSMIGAGSVALFATMRAMANLIRQLTGALNSALWPELTSLETQGRFAALREIHQLSQKLMLTVAMTTAALIHFQGAAIFS